VAQRRHPSGSGDGDTDFAVIGLVEPTADGPAVLPIQALMREDPLFFSSAMVVGPARDVLVVVDTGRPVELSTAYTYDADGRVVRTFRPLEFTDGAAVARVPGQVPRITLALRHGGDADRDQVELANFDQLAYGGRTNIQHPEYLDRSLPGWQAAWPADTPAREEAKRSWGRSGLARWYDPFSMLRAPDVSEWFLWGATPDGRRLVVQTMPHSDDPLRLLVTVGPAGGAEPEVRFAGFLDDPVLPIRVRLPQGQGVVVAANGATLRYRAGSSDWLPVTGDAALLPDAATAVQVTPPGGKATTVRLD
jgi:hypothetical protein